MPMLHGYSWREFRLAKFKALLKLGMSIATAGMDWVMLNTLSRPVVCWWTTAICGRSKALRRQGDHPIQSTKSIHGYASTHDVSGASEETKYAPRAD